MKQSRRQWIGNGIALGLGGSAMAGGALGSTVFQHGVASGDPHPDGLLIWTRVSSAQPMQRILGTWQVSTRPDFRRVAASGHFETDASRDFTVKVEVAGLTEGVEYWYRFRALGQQSPAGRARTLPTGRLNELNLALACCAVYFRGRFHAYAEMAKLEKLDAVVFVGDYIYEYGIQNLTPEQLLHLPEPTHDTVTLADYRQRYAQWRRDPALQAAHARAPWICMWDDHEVANDDWAGGAQNHDPKVSGPWEARKAVAIQAYLEWMPIRDPAASRSRYDVERSFVFGDLATLILPETRLKARDEQVSLRRDIEWRLVDISEPGRPKPLNDPALLASAPSALPAHIKRVPDAAALRRKMDDPARRMLGDDQLSWIESELRDSVKAGRPWVLFASETVMASTICPDLTPWVRVPGRQLKPSRIHGLEALLNSLYELSRFKMPMLGLDSWDGYGGERKRLYELFERTGARTVVLSGDSHMAWVNELHHEDRRVAVEVSASTLTGPTFSELIQVEDVPFGKLIAEQNRDVIWADGLAIGFIAVRVTPEAVRAEFINVDDTRAERSGVTVTKRVEVRAQAQGVGSWKELPSS